MLRESLEENLSAFGLGSGCTGRNERGYVGGAGLGRGTDINSMIQIGGDSRVLGRIRRFVQDHNFDSQILIKMSLEGSVVVHVVKRLDDDGRSRRQSRVAGLELQNAVVEFECIGGVQVAKNMNHDWLRFRLRVTAQSQEQRRYHHEQPTLAHSQMITKSGGSVIDFGLWQEPRLPSRAPEL